jgi:hypothetical protein
MSILLACINLGVAVLFIALGIPLARGRVHRNPWYGVRTAAAMASPENWDILNRYGGRRMVFAGVLLAIAGVVGLFVDFARTGLGAVLYALAPLWAIIPPTIGVLALGRRLERTQR